MSSQSTVLQAEIRELTIAHGSKQLERIGQGRCGTVWAICCSDCDEHNHLAMKREDGSTGRSIAHEYQIHQKLLRASPSPHSSSFFIPRSFGFLSSEDHTTWSSILLRLPADYAACNAIVSEKIMPVKASIRRLLVEKFRPDISEEGVVDSQSNQHCLIRPYLGRRRFRRSEAELIRGESRKRLRAFSLRNFPLHLDQMEKLGINPSDYALAMADVLAFLHWIAKVDGNDIEFVLAQPRRQPDASSIQARSENKFFKNANILGPHRMWILDFDLCRDLTLNEKGIEQASSAFWANDPFYPRPGTSNTADQRLWDIFEDQFLKSSAEALRREPDEVKRLPPLLIERIKQARAAASRGEVHNLAEV
ncbi:calcineurin-like phosphoesterase [Trichoderma arundinaceum]|uniref:Calcineurin-like phosphoesterase n=1 Tax=Trichoderma arundinaceum TaxID=490622 RepID=A0A395N939_TRIAR|nr:calcineurin-like phosphoesterase [Trichoderma arundinaceum]